MLSNCKILSLLLSTSVPPLTPAPGLFHFASQGLYSRDFYSGKSVSGLDPRFAIDRNNFVLHACSTNKMLCTCVKRALTLCNQPTFCTAPSPLLACHSPSITRPHVTSPSLRLFLVSPFLFLPRLNFSLLLTRHLLLPPPPLGSAARSHPNGQR